MKVEELSAHLLIRGYIARGNTKYDYRWDKGSKSITLRGKKFRTFFSIPVVDKEISYAEMIEWVDNQNKEDV